MRILAADSDLLAAAGRQRGFVDAVRGLDQRGHSVDVFYRDSGPLRDAIPSTCRTVQIPGFLELLSKGGSEPVRFVRSVFAGMPGKHDLVLVNRPELCAYAVALGTLKRIPSFCFLRDHRFGYSRRSRIVLGRVTHLIAVSRFIRDHYVHNVGMDPRRVHVVHSGVDTSYYRPATDDARARARAELGLPQDAFVILYAGRIDRTKGIDVLIEAFKSFASHDRNIHLVIAGSPNIEDHGTMPTAVGMAYQHRMMESSPSGRSTWVGHKLDVRPLYHAADVAVVPSRWGEAFGRAVLEPMSSGIPVLGSIDGGIPEALTGRFSEFLVPSDDPAALADALARIYDWREREPELGAACRDHVMRNFSLDREIDGVERLLSEAVGRHVLGPGSADPL